MKQQYKFIAKENGKLISAYTDNMNTLKELCFYLGYLKNREVTTYELNNNNQYIPMKYNIF